MAAPRAHAGRYGAWELHAQAAAESRVLLHARSWEFIQKNSKCEPLGITGSLEVSLWKSSRNAQVLVRVQVEKLVPRGVSKVGTEHRESRPEQAGRGHFSVLRPGSCREVGPGGPGIQKRGPAAQHWDPGRGSAQGVCSGEGMGTPPAGWSSQQQPPTPCGCNPTPLPPTGIIDLSQVPHLPVLVPPTPGTPATAMDRLAYLPTAPQHFSSRLSSSPLSPGDTFSPS